MFIVVMLGWWYSQGWLWAIQQIPERLRAIGQMFAVRVLLKTWFSPWKQITSASSFSNFFQAAVDNLVSRAIGSIIRGTMLFVALIWAILSILIGIIFVIIWPLLPLSIVILPLLALSGVTF